MIDTIKTAFLLILVFLSIVDGFYIHLWRLRLQERLESRAEHMLHTLRAWLFLPLLMLLSRQPSGALFYVLLACIGLDLLVGLADVLEEGHSRKSLGGLSRSEYLLHSLLMMLHSSLLALSLVTPNASDVSSWLAGMLLPGTVGLSLLHTWLIYVPHGISQMEKNIKACCRPASLAS